MSTLRRWTGLALLALATLTVSASAATAQFALPPTLLPAFSATLWSGAVQITWLSGCFGITAEHLSCHLARAEYGIDRATGAAAFRTWTVDRGYAHTDSFGETMAGIPHGPRYLYAGGTRFNIGGGGSTVFLATLDDIDRAAILADPVPTQYEVEVSTCWTEAPPGRFTVCGESQVTVGRVSVSVTPEPTTVALTAGGLLALASVARRRTRA